MLCGGAEGSVSVEVLAAERRADRQYEIAEGESDTGKLANNSPTTVLGSLLGKQRTI